MQPTTPKTTAKARIKRTPPLSLTILSPPPSNDNTTSAPSAITTTTNSSTTAGSLLVINSHNMSWRRRAFEYFAVFAAISGALALIAYAIFMHDSGNHQSKNVFDTSPSVATKTTATSIEHLNLSETQQSTLSSLLVGSIEEPRIPMDLETTTTVATLPISSTISTHEQIESNAAALVLTRPSSTSGETTAWKTLTSHPNSLVQLLPSRAMRVVQEVVRSLRKESHFIVNTTAGRIRGRFQKYRSGERGGYYSFKGIRYGLPPVGARRFRAPEPERPWYGIRDASREGRSCPHKNMLLDTFKGDEDCLFLNVFTPRMPSGEQNPKMPVMVWLHGGGFSFGSGNTFLYGPDYLVAENIVLVTLNYRLGPLGFLTAGPDAPGNQGLKDQVLALKWVRDNIVAFGGDPEQVTVFGESAGASSAQLLLLSPLAKGLFHRAISQSGSALNPWSMGEGSVKRASRLAVNLGYVGTNDTTQILDFLRRVSAVKLIEAAPTTLTAEDYRNNIGLPFVPVVEGYWNEESAGRVQVFHEPPFLTEHPSELYRQHKFHRDIPYIIGYNTHEAMLFIRRLRKNPQLLQMIDNDFERLVPHDINITALEREGISRDIRQFYLGTKAVGLESVDEMIALLTDLMFLQGIRKTARNHAKYGDAPVYMYRFAFDGALGLYKRMLGINRPGVCHGDEMGYLFKFGFFNLNLDPKSQEVMVKNRMVRMWTNFAKYGTPTPLNEVNDILNITWDSIDPHDVMNNINYMDITSLLEIRNNPESDRQQFWDRMYTYFNGNAM